MIKVLHLFTTLDGGGVESFLYNYYLHIDRNDISFDFVVPGNKKGYLEEPVINLGAKVFHVNTLRDNPIKQILQLVNIIKSEKYDIIHCHGYKSAIGIIIAWFMNCKVRIIHSHMAFVPENKIQRLIRKITTCIVKKLSTAWFACGNDAAKWLFGDKAFHENKVVIINNAIDLNKFKFNQEKRNRIRCSLDVESKLVLGNIARLTDQKNQVFLLKLLSKLKNIRHDVICLFIGNGEDKELLLQKSKELNVEDNVTFLGMREDVPDLLSALDIFVLPSKYEGLPVVLAEVQASGLVSMASEKITREINVTGLIDYLPIDSENDLNLWVDKICDLDFELDRIKKAELMIGGKYDISYQTKKLTQIYYILVGSNKTN